MKYALSRADQVPALDVGHLDCPSVVNPLGIKGVGESGIIAPAAAIANAVEDALADYGVDHGASARHERADSSCCDPPEPGRAGREYLLRRLQHRGLVFAVAADQAVGVPPAARRSQMALSSSWV